MNETSDPAQGTDPLKISFLLCALFLICSLLWNPELFTSLGKASYLPFFTPAALSFPAAAILCFRPEKPRVPKYIIIAVLGFGLILLGQFIMHISSWSIAQAGESLWWIAVPALACAHQKSIRKLLPVYVLSVGGYALVYAFAADLRGLWNAGITGNVNWTAALFVMTMIFLGWLIFQRWKNTACRSQRITILILGTTAELLLVWQFYRIGSKGAYAAVILTAAVFVWLWSGRRIRKILIAAALLGLLGGTFLLTRNTDAAAKFINNDGRVIFWENAIRLIADHPLFGVGQGSYENEYMTYRKADYFMMPNPAARSNHPHSHLLYMAGSWGITGLILWGILLFAPLAVMIRKYYRHEAVDPLDTACFLTLCYAVLHDSLDIIMITMPTGLIGLLCLGILSRHLADPAKPAEPLPFRKIMLIPAFVLCCMSVLIVWRSCHAALQVRNAYRNALTADDIIRTVQQCPSEYQANFALLNYLEKRKADPRIALAVTDVMLRSHTPNYPGLHLGRANALMRMGRFPEALQNYQKEAELFPLTLRPVYNMIVAARCMKNAALAAKLEEELRARMRFRGNDDNDLRIILTGRLGAHYDLRPRDKIER